MAIGTLWNPEAQLFDNAGAPLAGGKVFAYASGTLTPQNTYTTAALSVANANPVILDSAGRAAIFLDSHLVYKFIVKTSADVVLWTIDVVYPANYVTQATVVTSVATGTVNNWAPGLVGDTFVEWSGGSDLTVTGFAGGVTGQLVTVRNNGSAIAYFAYNSGSSSSGNKLVNAATSGPTPIGAGGFITYQYDGLNWLSVGHEQGSWIQPTYAGGNYTGNGSQVWTVQAGDVQTQSWRLRGREVTVAFSLLTTAVSGTPNTDLLIGNGAWGSFTIARTIQNAIGRTLDNNSVVAAYAEGDASGTHIRLVKTDQSNWANSGNVTEVNGQITMEVQ